jgi:hypothetical protein
VFSRGGDRIFARVHGEVGANTAATISRAIATDFGEQVAQVYASSERQARDRMPMANRVASNPTLVHHGLTRGAHFHVLGTNGTALADLYFTQGTLAEAVAETIADRTGAQVVVKRNILSGSGSIHTHMATVGARARRRNPSGDPQVGETWSTPGGGRCKIVARRGNRVTILHLETGNRETVDLLEFLASYRPPRTRANPCGNPRAPFEAGERVSVPYTGRSSYFGRPVKRTREKATVQGYDADGTVHVSVRRGRSTESHHFPASSVRRLPKRGAAPRRLRTQGVKRRIELKSLRERYRAALAAADKARDGRECAEARAKLIQPGGGDPPSAEYNRLLARIRKLTAELDAQESIAAELERQDPKWRDPWAAAAAPVTNRRGRKNPSRSARARASRAKHRAIHRRVGTRTVRAAVRAIRRPARPGNAAQSLYYLQHHHARSARRKAGIAHNPGRPRVVYNRLLGGWYVVVGPHQTPLNGRFDSKADAQEWLAGGVGRRANPKGRNWITEMADYHRDMGREQFVDHMLDRMPVVGVLRTRLRVAAGKAWDREHIGQGRTMAAERRAALESFDREFGKPNPKGRKPTIYEALRDRVGREPTNAELKAEVARIIREGSEIGRRRPGARRSPNPKGRSNPTPRELKLAAVLVKTLGFNAMAGDMLAGRVSIPDTFNYLLAIKGVPESRKVLLRTALAALERGYGSRAEIETTRRDAFAALEAEQARRRTPNRRPKASRKGRKPNPRGGSELERARRTFRKWHEFGSSKVGRVRGPSRVIPRTVVKLGEIRQIVYDSDKYAGGPDNPSGAVITYEHTTKRPRPLLVTDPDGRNVHIVGGRMQVTADGLKN